jgi:putative membrane protein
LILTPQQQDQIRHKIRLIEEQVFGEILVVIATRVTPIKWLSWVLPALFSWIGLSFSLVFQRTTLIEMGISFFFGALAGFLLSKIYRVQKALIPDWMEQKFVQREALYYFYAHRISRTVSRSGVLLFVSLFEREIDVIVDSELKSKISDNELSSIIRSGLTRFKKGEFFEGLMASLNQIELILKQNFLKPEIKKNEIHEELLLVSSPWD